MKRSVLYIFIAALCFFTACREAHIEIEIKGNDIIYATIEDVPYTKTYMDTDKGIRWESGDMVAAFMRSSALTRYGVADSSDGKHSAEFEKIDSDEDSSESEPLDRNVLFYPYAYNVSCSQEADDFYLDVILPLEQTYVPGSFGQGSFPMVAVSDNDEFSFRNVLGAMKLQVCGNSRILSVTLEGKCNEKLAGAAVIRAFKDNSAPELDMSSHSSTSLTLKCGAGVSLNPDSPTSFIMALPPMSLEKGFVVTLRDSDGKAHIIETDKCNEIRRSSVLVMPEVSLDFPDEKPKEGDYVDEYGVNHGQGIAIDGVVWAPVNCGYRKPGDDAGFPYGKLYQWGRRYGQGYSDDYSADALLPNVQNERVSADVGQSASNANVFYVCGSSPYDWVTPQNNYLWNTSTDDAPVRTANDPCPSGWRIPSYKEMKSLIRNKSEWTSDSEGRKGYWFCGSSAYSESAPRIFLAAAGYIGCGEGAGYSRGEYGYYWSSRPRKYEFELSSNLYFSEYTVTQGSGSRANGNSVRCVKDN